MPGASPGTRRRGLRHGVAREVRVRKHLVPSELEHLTGAVVRLAGEAGVRAPVNEFLRGPCPRASRPGLAEASS
ncbi:MAG: ketopantoate reductase C-terminal domain-containing protein [Actinomycetota bacterium]